MKNQTAMNQENAPATALLFAILFPEGANFRPEVSPAAAHVIVRAMGHLKGDVSNTFPSTKDGDVLEFGVNF